MCPVGYLCLNGMWLNEKRAQDNDTMQQLPESLEVQLDSNLTGIRRKNVRYIAQLLMHDYRIITLQCSPAWARDNPPSVVILLLPHFLTFYSIVQYLLLFLFSLSYSLHLFSCFPSFLILPVPEYTPTPFPGRMSQEATKPGFSFCVDFVLYVFQLRIRMQSLLVVFDLVLSCGVIVVSPCCRRQRI